MSGLSRRTVLQASAVTVAGTASIRAGSKPVSAAAGDEIWSYFAGDTVRSSPVVMDSWVYVGDDGGNIQAINRANSRRRWLFDTGGSVTSSPVVVDGVLFVGSQDGTLYAIDTESGDEEWSMSTGGSIDSSPVVASGTVFVGSDDGTVYAIDAVTGQERWSNDEPNGQIKSSPAVADGTVYVGSYDNAVYALDTENGRREWVYRTDGRIETSQTVANDTVYATSADGNVYSIDASSGEENWIYETEFGGLTAPTVSDNGPPVRPTVFVQDRLGTLFAVNAELGGLRWEVSTERVSHETVVTPAVVQSTVVFGNSSGTYGVELSSEEVSWDTDNEMTSAPIISDGDMYYGSGSDLLAADAGYSSASADDSRTWLATLGHHTEWEYADQTLGSEPEESTEPSTEEETTTTDENNEGSELGEVEVEELDDGETETESQTESSTEQSSGTSTTSDDESFITTALAGTAGAGLLLLGWLYKSLRSREDSVEDVDTYGNKSVEEELDGESTDGDDSDDEDTNGDDTDEESSPPGY